METILLQSQVTISIDGSSQLSQEIQQNSPVVQTINQFALVSKEITLLSPIDLDNTP